MVMLSSASSGHPKSNTPGPETLSDRKIRMRSPVSSWKRDAKSPRPDAKEAGSSDRSSEATTALPRSPGSSAVKYRYENSGVPA